jgi:hypothetical protein
LLGFLAFPALGQGSDSIFSPLFARDSLPYCTHYSDSEQVFIERHYLEQEPEEFGEVFYRKRNRLPESFLRKYLFGKSERVIIQNLWSRDTLGVDSIDHHLEETEYFALTIPIDKGTFVGAVIERLDEQGSELFFCTFRPNGQLISRILLGFYTHTGSYTTEYGGRAPWFPEQLGCIDGEHKIVTDNGRSSKKHYIIREDGQVILEK